MKAVLPLSEKVIKINRTIVVYDRWFNMYRFYKKRVILILWIYSNIYEIFFILAIVDENVPIINNY